LISKGTTGAAETRMSVQQKTHQLNETYKKSQGKAVPPVGCTGVTTLGNKGNKKERQEKSRKKEKRGEAGAMNDLDVQKQKKEDGKKGV